MTPGVPSRQPLKQIHFHTFRLVSSVFFGRCILLVIVKVTCTACYVQAQDSTSYYSYAGSSGTFTKTNDLKSFVINNVVKFTASRDRLSFQTSHNWVYGKQSDSKINDDISSVVELNLLKNERKLYYWSLGTFDKSYSLKIEHRFQVGAGVGYNFFQTPLLLLVLSDGFIYEDGNLTDADLGERNYNLWRNSLRLKYRWVISDILILDGSAFLQPSISTRHDTILKSSTTLSVKIKKWLSISSALNYNRITLTGRENLLVTYGVIFERFF